MFGRDNQDDVAEDNTVQVSVGTASTNDNTASTSDEPQDELNLPAPVLDQTTPVDEAADNSAPSFIETPAAPEVAHYEPVPDEELSTPEIKSQSTSDHTPSLDSLKKDALRELSPLIGHLEQSPEIKYATAKMVYEETNDKTLLATIYDAAKNLPDDKAKAEAIYDIVQKINDASK